MLSDGFWVAAGAVMMAAINMVGSVLMLWIRARYNYQRNGHDGKSSIVQPPDG